MCQLSIAYVGYLLLDVFPLLPLLHVPSVSSVLRVWEGSVHGDGWWAQDAATQHDDQTENTSGETQRNSKQHYYRPVAWQDITGKILG